MSSENMTPSLKIWLIALGIGLSSVAAIQINLTLSKYYIFEDYIKKQYQFFLSTGDSTNKKIIIVGNSLTRCAVPYTSEDSGKKFNYFRIVRDGFNLSEYISLLDDLAEQKPDFIFIQSDIMFINIEQPFDHRIEFLKYIVLDPKYSVERTKYLKQNTASDDLELNKIKMKDIDIKSKIDFLDEVQIYDESKISRIKSFLERVREKKIGIVFFDIPHTKELQNSLDSSAKHKEFNKVINDVAASVNAPRLSIMSYLPDSLFLDHSHFNVAGRSLFSSAFFNKIDSISGVKQ